MAEAIHQLPATSTEHLCGCSTFSGLLPNERSVHFTSSESSRQRRGSRWIINLLPIHRNRVAVDRCQWHQCWERKMKKVDEAECDEAHPRFFVPSNSNNEVCSIFNEFAKQFLFYDCSLRSLWWKNNNSLALSKRLLQNSQPLCPETTSFWAVIHQRLNTVMERARKSNCVAGIGQVQPFSPACYIQYPHLLAWLPARQTSHPHAHAGLSSSQLIQKSDAYLPVLFPSNCELCKVR